MEKKLQSSIIKIAQRVSLAELMIDEYVAFLTICIRSGGEDVKESDVRSIVSDAGLMQTIMATKECISAALGDNEGNVKGAGSE